MMDYVVHSFGGGDTLVQVFNAVGRIFASDSEYFTPVGKYAMTVGALWAGMKAIFKGNIADFGMRWLFPSFFAFIFLFTPKATVWVKDEVTMSAPVKVDNIPFGIAFFSSVSSSISYALSEMLEKHLLPLDHGLSIRKTGIMFGAKAVGKIRDVQIQNPTTLRNTKEYMRQCFIKPYILGDILGRKGAAMTSDDIIDFLEKNPPNNFGIYYRDPVSATNSFKTCMQATPLIKIDLAKELNDGLLTKFAVAIGMHSDKPEQLKLRLKTMTQDTLRYLKKDQADIHSWMKQAMLLNASREGFDDWREKHSLKRIYPELIAMNATRGIFQQAFGWLTIGEMAANMMPILQSAFASVIICLIFIVFPMSMLPGGYNILKLWITLMIWVNSWPVFFTVIHCLGMISLSHKSLGLGSSGMSILSQGGFSEITLNSYATYQMLAASVPMLAYAVLKACSHATTSLAGSLSPVGVAATIGANTADNNLSIDNISHGSRSISQANYASSLNIGGGAIDDGGMRVVTNDFGKQIINQAVDNMPTNYRYSNMRSDSIQSQLLDSQMRMGSLTNRQSELFSVENRHLMDLADRFVKGEVSLEGMSYSEQEAIRANLSKGVDLREGTNSRESKDTATNSSLNAGFELMGTGGKTGTSATSSVGSSKDRTVTNQQGYNEAFEQFKNASKTHGFNASTEKARSLVTGLNNTRSEQQSIGSEIVQTQQTMQSLQHLKSYVDSNSATIDRNFNEEVLQKVIDTHLEISSKEQAARWISSHPREADQIAQELMPIHNSFPSQNWGNVSAKSFDLASIDSQLASTPMKSKENLKNEHESSSKKLEQQATVKDAMGHETPLTQQVKNDIESARRQYNNDPRQVLYNNLDAAERVKAQELNSSVPLNIVGQQKDLENKYNNTPNSTIVRTIDEVGKMATEIDQSIQSEVNKYKEKK